MTNNFAYITLKLLFKSLNESDENTSICVNQDQTESLFGAFIAVHSVIYSSPAHNNTVRQSLAVSLTTLHHFL